MNVKLITQYNKDILEEDINEFIDNEDIDVKDIKLCVNNEDSDYCALILYEPKQIDHNTCLHCGKHIGDYCEECYQDLISKNMKLQLQCQDVINSKQNIITEGNNLLDETISYLFNLIKTSYEQGHKDETNLNYIQLIIDNMNKLKTLL